MRIVYNRFIPFGKNFLAVNLFGILFSKGRLSDDMLRHEEIHTAQMKELLFIAFYLLYILEWIFRLIQYGFTVRAYYNISFEREAYDNMRNPMYLNSRRHFAFLTYIKNPIKTNNHATGRNKTGSKRP